MLSFYGETPAHTRSAGWILTHRGLSTEVEDDFGGMGWVVKTGTPSALRGLEYPPRWERGRGRHEGCISGSDF
jgi:hypothetical protein